MPIESKHKGPGRPQAYTDPNDLWEDFVEYVNQRDKNPWKKQEPIKGGPNAGSVMEIDTQLPYTITSFAVYAGISEATFYNLAKNEVFLEITTRIKEICKHQQIDGATVGAFNHNIVARLNGLADHQVVENTGDVKALVITPASELKTKD